MTRAKLLLVDDEPAVLEGLSLSLARKFTVLTATSGALGLSLLAKDPDIAVVMSDMRMPAMDGATFLATAKERGHQATRLLLTGQTDLDSAIAAVNRGQIFRFLSKPCAPPDLARAIEDAVEQHRLLTAERELLQQTLFGSIAALTDVLAISHPAAFGRATRIQKLVGALAERLALTDTWQIEMAALLSHLGYISLPTETLEKVQQGHALSAAEQQMLARTSTVTEQLLKHIPRLETVRAIIAAIGKPLIVDGKHDPDRQRIQLAASLIVLARDYDALEHAGREPAFALATLRGRPASYNVAMLEALQALRVTEALPFAVKELGVPALRVGMVFADEVRMASGALLAPKGYAVTPSFLERLRNTREGAISEPLFVSVGL